SMDQITIDLTGLPENLARVGAEIELIGSDPQGVNHLPVLAKAAGSITHELLCRVCPGIERVYISPAGVAHARGGGAGGSSTAGGSVGDELPPGERRPPVARSAMVA